MSLPRHPPPDPAEAQRRALEDPVLASVVRAADEARDTDCPDAEWLALYAERQLGASETALVQPHLQTCDRCQAIVAACERASAGAPHDVGRLSPATGWFERWFGGWRWLVPLASAAAVAVVAVAVMRGPAGAPAPAAEAPASTARLSGAAGESPNPGPDAAAAPAPTGNASSTAGQMAAGPVGRRADASDPGAPASSAERMRAGRLAPADAPPSSPALSATPSAREAEPDRQQVAAAKSAGALRDGARVAEAVASPPPPAAAPAPTPAPALPAPGEIDLRAGRARVAVAPEPAVADARAAAATAAGGAAMAGRPAANAIAAPTAAFRADASLLQGWRLRGGVVERSRDRGTTWQPVPTPAGVRVTAIAAAAPAVCWAVGDGVVLRSVDGATWARTATPAAEGLTSIAATSAVDASVTTASGARLVTTDGGATWRRP